MQPMIVGMLTSAKRPGAQLPSMAHCTVLSSPSRVAAKQQTTNPNANKNAVLRPPIQDAGAAPYRIADETQQRKNHDRCNGCYRVPEIKLHINTSYNKKTSYEP